MLRAHLIRKRSRGKVIINVTSLIDVLFLLLIFFMVSSTFAEQPSIQLELPEAATAQVSRVEPWVLSITRDEKLFLNDQPMTLEALEGRLRELAETNPEKAMVLKADEEVSYGLVIEILDLAKQSGLKRISALTRLRSHSQEK
jgi:biopolymer transport protein ExbD